MSFQECLLFQEKLEFYKVMNEWCATAILEGVDNNPDLGPNSNTYMDKIQQMEEKLSPYEGDYIVDWSMEYLETYPNWYSIHVLEKFTGVKIKCESGNIHDLTSDWCDWYTGQIVVDSDGNVQE